MIQSLEWEIKKKNFAPNIIGGHWYTIGMCNKLKSTDIES